MKEIEVSRVLPAPVAETFHALSDFAKAPERTRAITALEILGGGPVQSGTRFRETRKMGRFEATEEMEILDWAPPKGYTIVCDSHGTHYRTLFSFAPEGAGKRRVTMRFGAEPRTLMAEVMAFFSGGKMRKMVADCIAQDMADIATWLEGRRGASLSAVESDGAQALG